eukprot:scaffold10259_cov155-Amphora_coffeaeformis.AAC.4
MGLSSTIEGPHRIGCLKKDLGVTSSEEVYDKLYRGAEVNPALCVRAAVNAHIKSTVPERDDPRTTANNAQRRQPFHHQQEISIVFCLSEEILLHSFDMTMASTFRNAMVTGANRGLGLETCRQMATHGDFSCIYAVCRKSSPELKELASGDNSKDGSVVPISLLVHNAGAYGPPEGFVDPNEVYSSQSLDNITPERLLYAFQLNSAAPLFLTKHLLPNLRASQDAKVVIISSAIGLIAENGSGGHYGYRAAKAAVNMIGKSLSTDLKDDNILVGLLHPGFVHTGFGSGPGQDKRPGQRDMDESARGVLQAIDKVTMETTGSFWHGNYGKGVTEFPW